MEEALSQETLGETFTPELQGYVARLVNGSRPSGEAENRLVSHLTGQWELERLALTDRVLLALASHELWDEPTIPPKVTISEYVKLAHLYGTAESRRFLNGVLGSLLKVSPKADWSPAASKVPLPEAGQSVSVQTDEHVPAEEDEVEESEDRPKSRWVLKSDG